jgi:hypothetical protein
VFLIVLVVFVFCVQEASQRATATELLNSEWLLNNTADKKSTMKKHTSITNLPRFQVRIVLTVLFCCFLLRFVGVCQISCLLLLFIVFCFCRGECGRVEESRAKGGDGEEEHQRHHAAQIRRQSHSFQLAFHRLSVLARKAQPTDRT